MNKKLDTLKAKIKRYISADRTTLTTNLIAIILPVSAFLYNYLKKTEANTWLINILFWTFIVCAIWSILVAIIRIIVYTKYRELTLRYNRSSGVLYDWPTRFKNVALRTTTLSIIIGEYLKNIGKIKSKNYASDCLRDTGLHVGKSFFIDMEKYYQTRALDFESMTDDQKMKLWIKYDSSAGMGLLEYEFDKDIKTRFTVRIRNCFLSGTRIRSCRFFEGYIQGLCAGLLQKKIIVKEVACGRSKTGTNTCVFECEKYEGKNI